MQRSRTALLVLIIVAALLAACGGTPAASGDGSSSAPSAVASTAPTIAPESPAESPGESPAESIDVGGAGRHDAPELEARLPNDLGGEAVLKQSIRGSEAMEGLGEEVTQLVSDSGKSPEDFTLAVASNKPDNPDWFSFMMRIDGVAGSAIRDAMVAGNDETIFASSDQTLGGKTVTQFGPNGEAGWVYAAADVVFTFLGTRAQAEEFYSKVN